MMKILTWNGLRKLMMLAAVSLAAGVAPAIAAEPQKVTFMTEWAPHGFHAPFYLAQQKGWFKEAGIDFTLRDGRGSGVSINLIGAGQIDIGFVNLSAAVIARSKGVPITVVASVLRKNTNGLILKKGSPITKPADLRGKTVLYATTTIEGQALDGFLAAGGMTRNDVKPLGVDAPSKVSSVLSGKGDAAVGPIPFYLGLLAGKSEIDTVLFADFDLPMMDFGIVVHEKMVKSNPDVVAAFVKVLSRAFEYTMRDNNVEEAVKIMIAMRPEANLDFQTSVNMFKSHALFIPSPSTAGKPVGYISREDMEDTIKTLKRIGVVVGEIKATDVYTPRFNPQ